MKKLMFVAVALFILSAPSAFACTGCQSDYTCNDGWAAWCYENYDHCVQGGSCSPAPQQQATVAPLGASWQVASVEVLDPAALPAKAHPVQAASVKVASLEPSR